LPGVTAQHTFIHEPNFFNTVFDAVVAWGVLFHLTELDQETVIVSPSRACHLGLMVTLRPYISMA
jgi:hypothetical protein